MGKDRKVVAVAIDGEADSTPFFGAEINNKQWERYLRGAADLRYLFLFPHAKRWYHFDLSDIKGETVLLSEAPTDDHKNEEFLPSAGFFSRDHTEDLKSQDSYQLNSYEFGIDGAWELSDFSKFYGKFSDLYSFYLSLRKYVSDATGLPEKRVIRKAFIDHPLKGGSSYVNLYHDLFSAQGRDRLSVQSIQYASPGHVAVSGRKDTFEEIFSSLSTMMNQYDEISTQYKYLHSYLSDAKLLKPDEDKFDPDGPVADFIYGQTNDLAQKMGFEKIELIHELTNQNSLLTAKVLLSHYRRLQAYYMFFAEGRVSAPPEADVGKDAVGLNT